MNNKVIGLGGVSAKIIADSVSTLTGTRITTYEIEVHRFVWAELMTHRCLIGDTKLTFDIDKKSNGKKSYTMTLKDFHDKFNGGVNKHKPSKLKSLDFSKIEPEAYYTAKDISKLVGLKTPSNIRVDCVNGKLKVKNKTKNINDDWLILGADFIEYRKNKENSVRTFSIKERLKNMNIRMYNEETKQVDHTKITDCWYVGEKEVFELKTECGKSVTSTDDHLILTNRGWLELKDINIGDSVMVSTTKKQKTKSGYRKVNNIPINTFNKNVIKCLSTNQDDKCFDCQHIKKLEVHHVIPIHVDESKALEVTNCVALCNECHKNRHSTQGWQKGNSLNVIESKVVSITPKGIESVYDISVDSKFHNFIANDIVVHNCFSRNAASSRAITVKSMIDLISNNPAIPIHWSKNQRGMQGHIPNYEPVEIDGKLYTATEAWLMLRDIVAKYSLAFSDAEYHKQVSNRLSEPFQIMKAVITSTEFENFYNLRLEDFENYQAAHEIHEVSVCMYKARQLSKPKDLNLNEWHTPYYQDGRFTPKNKICNEQMKFEIKEGYSSLFDDGGVNLLDALKVSSSCSAQISYRKLDESIEKAIDIYEKLVMSEPVHASALEHCATPTPVVDLSKGLFFPIGVTSLSNRMTWQSGNFENFVQFRQLIKNHDCREFKLKGDSNE